MIKPLTLTVTFCCIIVSASPNEIIINDADYVFSNRKKDENISKIFNYIKKKDSSKLQITMAENPGDKGLAITCFDLNQSVPPLVLTILEDNKNKINGGTSTQIYINMFYRLPDELKTPEAQQQLLKLINSITPDSKRSQKILLTEDILIFKNTIFLPSKDSLFPVKNIRTIVWNTISCWSGITKKCINE